MALALLACQSGVPSEPRLPSFNVAAVNNGPTEPRGCPPGFTRVATPAAPGPTDGSAAAGPDRNGDGILCVRYPDGGLEPNLVIVDNNFPIHTADECPESFNLVFVGFMGQPVDRNEDGLICRKTAPSLDGMVSRQHSTTVEIDNNVRHGAP